MKNIKMFGLASLLIAGVAQAGTPCEGFEIKIKNNLVDDLLLTEIKMAGASIQPGVIEKISNKTAQLFTIKNTRDGLPIEGQMIFHTDTLPSKEVTLDFKLHNSGLICEHTDNSPNGVYSVKKTRLPSQVEYTIYNK